MQLPNKLTQTSLCNDPMGGKGERSKEGEGDRSRSQQTDAKQSIKPALLSTPAVSAAAAVLLLPPLLLRADNRLAGRCETRRDAVGTNSARLGHG